MSKATELLSTVLERGFDQSALADSGGVSVRCSQCEALVINHVPCHEPGCPNIVKPCRECGGYGHIDCGLYPEQDPDEWEIDARMAEEAHGN